MPGWVRSLFERLSADPIRISAASAPWLLHLLWATGYNTFAIPLAAGIGYSWGFLLSPAACAALISLSTVIVAINAKLLERARKLVARASAAA